MKLFRKQKLLVGRKPQRIKTRAIAADELQIWIEQSLTKGLLYAAFPIEGETRIIGCEWQPTGYVRLTLECPAFKEVPAGEAPPLLLVHYHG